MLLVTQTNLVQYGKELDSEYYEVGLIGGHLGSWLLEIESMIRITGSIDLNILKFLKIFCKLFYRKVLICTLTSQV